MWCVRGGFFVGERMAVVSGWLVPLENSLPPWTDNSTHESGGA